MAERRVNASISRCRKKMRTVNFIYHPRVFSREGGGGERWVEKMEDFRKHEATKAESRSDARCPMNDSALNLIFIASRLTCPATAGTDLFVRYDIVNGLCATHKSSTDRTRGKLGAKRRKGKSAFSPLHERYTVCMNAARSVYVRAPHDVFFPSWIGS